MGGAVGGGEVAVGLDGAGAGLDVLLECDDLLRGGGGEFEASHEAVDLLVLGIGGLFVLGEAFGGERSLSGGEEGGLAGLVVGGIAEADVATKFFVNAAGRFIKGAEFGFGGVEGGELVAELVGGVAGAELEVFEFLRGERLGDVGEFFFFEEGEFLSVFG